MEEPLVGGSPGGLRAANDHLADPARLRALFAEEGYLFLRGVLDVAAVRAVHRQMVRILVEQGMAEQGMAEPGMVKPGMAEQGMAEQEMAEPVAPAPEPVWCGASSAEFAERGERSLQELYGELELWQRLVAAPSIASFFAWVLGAPAAFIPLARYRVAPPGGATVAHRDATLNPGFDMTTVWIPLMGIDAALGGLTLVPGSHRDAVPGSGSASPRADVGGRAGPSASAGTAPAGPWCGAEYEPGDVVLMHEALLHAGVENRSPRGVRLSVDVRFQNPSSAAAVVGRVDEVGADWIRVRCDDDQTVTLAIDEGTLLRGKSGQTIAHAQLSASDLEPGLRVIASRRGATAVVVRPL